MRLARRLDQIERERRDEPPVLHIIIDGEPTPEQMAAAARERRGGIIVWDQADKAGS